MSEIGTEERASGVESSMQSAWKTWSQPGRRRSVSLSSSNSVTQTAQSSAPFPIFQFIAAAYSKVGSAAMTGPETAEGGSDAGGIVGAAVGNIRNMPLEYALWKGPGFCGELVPLEEIMAGIVVVFDFDKTIIDCDSDNWVVDELGATDLFNQLLPSMPWNSLMDRMMSELHAQGKTIDDIAECLKRAPLHPRIISAIKSAYALGCELRIVSDANLFFIETILKHYGLLGYFSEIITNPCFVDEEGKLRILPYHDFKSSSHGCLVELCPPNMCKGTVIEGILASISTEEGGKKRIIYLGDGNGDYCPSLKLREGDFVMPRKNYPLWNVVSSSPVLLKAEIHKWSDGEELERVLLCLVNAVLLEESSYMASSIDCKPLTTPLPAQEPLPMALPASQ